VRRVEHAEALRLTACALQIDGTHAFEELALLSLEAIGPSAPLRWRARARPVPPGVEQQRQVRLQVRMDDGHQRVDLRDGQAAAAALVGVGGVGEPIAEHPLTAGNGRSDEVVEVRGASGEHQQQLAGLRHRLRTPLEQDLAQALGPRRAAGLARDGHFDAVLAQPRCGARELRRLARAFAALERDESTLHLNAPSCAADSAPGNAAPRFVLGERA